MRNSTLRATVGVIVIFGHFFVFLAGLSLGVFSLLGGNDAMQTLLMASPVLAVIATAAFSFIIDNHGRDRTRARVGVIYAVLCISFPAFLIVLILLLFYMYYLQVDYFGPEKLKIALGGVETFFGAYIGAISKSLFGGANP